MRTAISVKNLSVAYSDHLVVKNVTLDIPEGIVCAVVGPNGAGKTTFIKTLLHLIDPVSGIIEMNSTLIAYVPQRRTIDWDFPITVLDVVLMGRYKDLGWFRRPTEYDKELALQSLDKVKLRDYAHRHISELSGGERQRIFLARALVQNADIYIMDEPFIGVDAFTERMIVEVLKTLRQQGKTIIVVHHDLQTLQEYFDWVVLLNIELIAAGPLKEVFTKKNIEKTYGALPVFLALKE